MIPPIELLNSWLAEEQSAGAPNPRQAVLATCTKSDDLLRVSINAKTHDVLCNSIR